ncbi:hypothetical protein [Rhodococcus sp. NPDC003348]
MFVARGYGPQIPQVGNVTSATGITSSLSLTLPAAATDDLLLLFISHYGTYSSTPSGWTQRQRLTNSTSCGLTIFSKVKDGSEGSSLSLTGFDANGNVEAFGVQVTGGTIVDTSNGQRNSTNTTSHVAPAMTTTRANCLILGAGASITGTSGAANYTFPAPFTHIQSLVGANNSGYGRLGIGQYVQEAMATIGPWTFTGPYSTSQGWAAGAIAIAAA